MHLTLDPLWYWWASFMTSDCRHGLSVTNQRPFLSLEWWIFEEVAEMQRWLRYDGYSLHTCKCFCIAWQLTDKVLVISKMVLTPLAFYWFSSESPYHLATLALTMQDPLEAYKVDSWTEWCGPATKVYPVHWTRVKLGYRYFPLL